MQNQNHRNNQHSSLRHYSEAKLDFSDLPILIVGKGPSYSPQKIKDYSKDGYVLVSINDAWTRCEENFQLCFFSDWPVTAKFEHIERVDCFFAGTCPFNEEADYLMALKNYKQYEDRIFFYDHDRPGAFRLFKDKKPVKLQTSTTEAAVEICARLGARDFSFIGVDGTATYHRLFKQRHRSDFLAAQFSGLRKSQEKHNLTFTFVRDKQCL